MTYIVYAVAAFLFLLFLVYYFAIKKRTAINGLALKIVSLALAGAFFVRYFLSGSSMLDGVLNFSKNNPFDSNILCGFVAIAIWLHLANLVVVFVWPWFWRFRLASNVAKTLGLLSSLVNVALLPYCAFSLSGTYGASAINILYAVEVAVCLSFNIYILLQTGLLKMTRREIVELAVALLFVLFVSIPPYLPQVFFGNKGYFMLKGLRLYHRVYLYICFIFTISLFLLLKQKDANYNRICLLYISLCTLISYCYKFDFSIFTTPYLWPLHLCNTAMFLTPICLIFKTKGLYYFTLFINVLGAFFAMLMPTVPEGAGFLSTAMVAFWINHIIAFSMPLLILLLGVYERPKIKQFFYSLIWFAVYYLLVLFLNSYFTASGHETDFFFINSGFVADKLGSGIQQLRRHVSYIGLNGLSLKFYPIYQLLYFIVYIGLGLAVWFVLVYLCQVRDLYVDLYNKKRKIKLDELALCVKYGKKDVNDCMNERTINKLVLKDVCKKYANSKTFAAKDVSMEVKSGEIFGFLGPNGAGKSTIIKCIVGIQPPTSGTIEINGYDIEKQPVLAKSQLGFVPDHYALYERLTGREYINYIADLYGVSKEDRDKRIAKYVKILALESSFDNKIQTYSHGMKQKVAIIAALVHNPKLWILDEPLTGLDPTSIFQVKECMKEHAKNGNIVFFSSHIIDIVEKLCSRIMVIKGGQIHSTAKLKDLKKQNLSLEQYYMNIIENKDQTKKQRTKRKNEQI